MMQIHTILFTTMESGILKYCGICDIKAEITAIWTLIWIWNDVGSVSTDGSRRLDNEMPQLLT